MDKKKFANALLQLFESKLLKYSQETITIWYELLNKYPEEKVLKALYELTMSSDNFISVGKIVEKIGDTVDARVEHEWKQVLASARKDGWGEISPRSGAALVGLGGLDWLINSPRDKTEWQKKEFINAYKNTPEPKQIDFICRGLKVPFGTKLLTQDI